jgi:DTW domain-containing protein
MARSVVLQTTVRCERCQLTPRWCICAGFTAVTSPLQVDVLMHRREFHRPTSTGHLIHRVVTGARLHLFRTESPPAPATVALPGRELWILHPRGDVVPSGTPPADVQVLLLDGSWREAARMIQTVGKWGRPVRLPPAGPSRNQLRQQEVAGQYATVESLIFLYAALGLEEAAQRLRLQFELHVYAGLRTRGARLLAEEFLASSPIRAAFPELLERLHERRRA